MPSSGEVWVLSKMADLCMRFGINPTVADIGMELCHAPLGRCYYSVMLIDNPGTPDEEQKIAKISALLGLDELGRRNVDTVIELNKIVDRALALAPSPRSR